MVHVGGCACLSTVSVCPRQGFPLGSSWAGPEAPLWRRGVGRIFLVF
ncbi:hypothetical protein CGRA01v4_04749 [Colletotrichum graminicola]|nr:hypothetical protein CGRA01v4_04749 [Colletotrichum graminicola]